MLADEHIQSVDRGIPEIFVVVNLVAALFLGDPEVAPSPRHVYFIALHGGMVAMVTMVGDLPAEVRRPQQGVDRLEQRWMSVAAN